ncbi:uncharacterized protein LOC144904280 isoform X3 [Branchiostoma floridae x Branchiostoma belcheri]
MKSTLLLCATVFIVLGSTAGGTRESFGLLDSRDLQYRVRRQEPLAFAKRPVSISAELEDTVIFECSAESTGGQTTLTWYKDDQRVTSSQTGIFLLANKNLLVLVSRDNLGTYTCQLELGGDVIRSDATLTLKSDEEKIEFLERPQNASVNFGERQVFRCKVTGDLQPTWLKDASSMFLDGQRVFQHRGDLHITSATVADTGRYTCQVRTDGQHTAEAHAWLAVNVDTELVCGRPVYKKGPEGFIVGGTEADPGTIPWQAMLWDVRPSRNRHFCGGALVNSQWVITAAHCIVEAEVTKDDFIVRLGKQVARRGVLEENERSYTVQEVIVYEGFVHDTYDADLALIRLTERVLYTDYILPVCLPSVDRARRLIRPGSAGTVSGWGRVVEGGPYSNVLKKVLIPRVSQGRCRKAHPQYDVTRNMFCAGRPGGGEDACDGDSGGPFTVYDEDREYLLGVVSWGDGCALAGKFGVYTRLHKFFTWIQAIVVEESQEDAGCVTSNLGAIANGRVAIDSSATPAQARYFCDAGYRLEGTAVRVCEVGGRWSDEPPRCTALQCPPVESPRNGVVETPRRQHGDMATYTCDSGYELKGPRSRVCQYGQWVGNEPRCEPMACPIPMRPENGDIRYDRRRPHGSLATYTCTAGYELAGPHMRECVNGQWTGSQPVCEKRAVLCPPVEAPENGAVQVSGRQTGDRARFTCAPGYEIRGPQSILCQEGVWAGDEPTCEPQEEDFPRDCTDWYDQGQRDSGVYSVQPRGSDDIFSAWCEFDDGGAWTVIQRRQDGSVDFFRNWQEYKDGFGDVAGEYWLGNKNIYHLTNQAKYKLRIDLEDFDGRKFFVEYSQFRVENEADDYRLRLGNHSGNIGDGMTKLDRDQPFTTKDHGARQGSHCARVQKTGWWFGEVCLNWANLNGMYKDSGEYTGEQNGIFWFPLRLIGYPKLHSLKKVTMKLRRLAEPGGTDVQPTPTPAPEECTGQCGGSNCDLKSVVNPIDHKTSGFNQGAWMKDPTGDPDTIYYMNNYYVGSILVYRNLDDFKNDRLQRTIKVSACGTGHAVYNGNFYSTRYHSNKMFKMNLKTGATVERILPDAGSKNTYHYQGKALTDIDFAVDEKGLWVIYATPQNGGRIVVSRLDPEDLSIIQTWNTTYTKRNAANAFMICGVLYTVVRQRGVDYSFNTTTGEEGTPGLPFPTVTSDIRHLSYNPRERRLYAWRAGHQVTYDLEISGLPDKESLPKLCRGKVCKDCSDAFNYHKQDGVYTIEPEVGVSFQVYCRMVDGAGYTVIQRRKDGSENFFRTWDDYKNGFGSPGNEQWLGNEKIHALTKRGLYKLHVDLADFQGNEGFAEYDLFYLAGEKDRYTLRLGRYSGTAKDSLSYHANFPFSTKDRDNDGFWSNCAANDKGGWWYDGCYASNLNGQWYPEESHTRHPDGLVWWQWPYWDNNYHFSLRSTEMRIQFQPDAQDTELYVDCDAVKRSGERVTGVFWIRPRDTVEPFPVHCDLQDGDAAWTVIQQRNHTVGQNFTRGWEDYKNGFGVIPREYWLGNDKIHQLTKDGDHRVKIQVHSFSGLQRSYEYDNFKVAGEDENYRLTLSGFTGRVESCMERAGADWNGMAFSTMDRNNDLSGIEFSFSSMDRDNDKTGYNCAERWKGGWWYRSCSLLILNGVIKEYSGHDEYREVTGRGEGLYNVCLQQGPPVSLNWVSIKIQAREQPDVYRDCDHARSDGKTVSGVYQLQPRGATQPFSAFCEMESSKGSWTVIQRRTKQGTVNFTRGWEDYKRGFGDLEGELWLGLENIFLLTNQGQYALQIDFKSYTGVSGYTLYSSFKVSSESDHYRLHLGNRRGGISDCLNTRSTGKNVTGMAFTTFDRDHDMAGYNCAEKYRGGWWFNSCSSVILNGVKKYWRTHDQYYQEVRQGLGLYNVCLQQGPPVSLSDVTMKISIFPNLS